MARPRSARGAWTLQVDAEWIGRWNDPATGRRRQITLAAHGILTESERAQWKVQKATEVETARRIRRSYRGGGRTSLGEAADAFYADCLGRDLRASTIRRYRETLLSFTAWLAYQGRRATQEISATDLMAYRADVMRELDRGPVTKGNHLTRLQAALEWLRRHRFLPLVTGDEISDACVKPPRPRPSPVVYRVPQLQEIMTAAAERKGGHLAAVALLTGCRIGELETLRRDELDLESAPGGEIRLGYEDGPKGPRTKTRMARTIDLSVSPLLREVLRAIPDRGPFVFGGEKPLDRNAAYEWKLALQFGKAWTWKDLRSTCGTFLACAPGIWGASSAYRAARQLGHSVTIAERHYLGVLRGISPEAKTLEAAMEIELPLAALVARLRG